jgi:hypothetical protein
MFSYPPGGAGAGPITISGNVPTIGPLTSWATPLADNVTNIGDLAVSPDGTTLVPAAGYPYEFEGFSTTTFNPSDVVYPANPYPQAVAMTGANGGLFAGGMNAPDNPDLLIFRLGDPADRLAVGPPGEVQRLAFSSDGTLLFSVEGDETTDAQFVVYDLSGQLSPSVTQLSFGSTRVGDGSQSRTMTINDTGLFAGTIDGFSLGGSDPDDFIGATDCQPPSGEPGVLSGGQSCAVAMAFIPGTLGPRQATLTVDLAGQSPITIDMTGTGTEGYYEAGAQGAVYPFGDAQNYGDMSHAALNAPIVSMATTPDGNGYYLLGADGGIYSFGDAAFFGSTGGIRLNKPVVGMAPTPDGQGYWLVATDGGIFAFGDAPFYGSTGNIHLNKPVVAMAATTDGGGYWLVASDGGIFAYGDAQFYGSTGNIHLNKPVVAMASTPDSGGYWLVASDGGVFAYGDARFYGSTGNIHLNDPIVGMAPSPTGDGYWFAASDGGIFNYGDAPFYGSTGGTAVRNIVAMAGTAPPTLQAFLDVPARALHRPSLPRGWRLIA